MNISNTSNSVEYRLGLDELLRISWSGRWLILAVTILFTTASAAAAWLIPKQYEASIIVSPVSSASGSQLGGGGLGSVTSQIGGLASLAGISLGGENSKRSEYIAVLQSEALTERYIQENKLLPVLFENKWDATKSAWKTHDPDKMPTLWKANRYFKKNVRDLAINTKTGLVTLTITWKDPKLAAKWANDLVSIANDYLRDKAIHEAQRNIAYLNEEAAKTNIVEAKQAIYTLMKTEISREMIARGSEEYAFRIIDPATQPEKPSFPIKIAFVVLGFAGGLILSTVFVYVRARRKDRSKP
jgi:uncharacterized protein involved in exopolysaccharide biosynthesis